MTALPEHPDDVKLIKTAIDPCTGKWVTLLELDEAVLNRPVAAGIIPPQKVFYKTDQINHPDVEYHPAGLAYIKNKDGTISIPHKDFSGIPFRNSKPADMTAILYDLSEGQTIKWLDGARTVVTFIQTPQPGELESWFFKWLKTRQLPDYLLEADGETDRHNQGQTTSQEQDLDPGPSEAPVSESDPAAGTAAKPQKRSVGTKRKFTWIEPGFLELMEADGLSMSCIETYRIIKTYRKYPEKTRKRANGEGPRDRFSYTITLQSQISEYLKTRRKDMIATARGDRRKQAKKMGVSPRTVKYNIATLCRRGYIGRVYRGRPKEWPKLTEDEKALRNELHERHPQWGPTKYRVAIDKRQRDYLKTLDRKLRKAGLPPYHIYLKNLLK